MNDLLKRIKISSFSLLSWINLNPLWSFTYIHWYTISVVRSFLLPLKYLIIKENIDEIRNFTVLIMNRVIHFQN